MNINFDELLKRTSLTLIVLGVVLLTIAAIGGLPIGSQSLLITEPIWRYILAVTGIVLLGTGLFLLWRENSQPKDGAQRKSGTVSNLSQNELNSLKSASALSFFVDCIPNLEDRLREAKSISINGITLSRTSDTLWSILDIIGNNIMTLPNRVLAVGRPRGRGL